MTLRITPKAEVPLTVLQVDGRLDVDSTRHLVDAWRATDGPVALDLKNLRWMDEAAAEVIRRLAARGVQLLHLSPLHEVQLEGTPLTSEIDDA